MYAFLLIYINTRSCLIKKINKKCYTLILSISNLLIFPGELSEDAGSFAGVRGNQGVNTTPACPLIKRLL